MLTFTNEAMNYAKTKNKPVFLELYQQIGCCIDFREAPTVAFGEPYNINEYTKLIIDDLIVYVPEDLPAVPLTVVLTSFLGFKKLAVEGWVHA